MRALLLAIACSCGSPQSPDRPAFEGIELVESSPVETTLDSSLRDAAEVWPEMFASAKHSIDLAEFYLSNEPGSRLEPVVKALEAALARGVHVRLLVEPSFEKIYPDTIERLARAGVIVRRADFSPGILHAKYFIVDDEEAFVGSQNFDWRALDHILELGVRLHGPTLVQPLAALFATDWARAGEKPAPIMVKSRPASGPVTIVASPRDRLPANVAWDLAAILDRIDRATTRVRVQLLTYLAGDWIELESALLSAATRGVRIELLLADWTKRPHTIAGLQALARHDNVEIRLVTIPPARRGFIPFARVIHAKFLVADGRRAWLGTSNWEREYFYDSRNVGLAIDHAQIATQLDQFFERTWTSPYATRLDPAARYEPPRIE